jgi:hypothetical protein
MCLAPTPGLLREFSNASVRAAAGESAGRLPVEQAGSIRRGGGSGWTERFGQELNQSTIQFTTQAKSLKSAIKKGVFNCLKQLRPLRNRSDWWEQVKALKHQGKYHQFNHLF